MTEKMLKATYGSKETPLRIGEASIECYVLEDGRRVLSGNGMTVSLGMTVGGNRKPSSLIKRSWLEPYISSDLAYAINNPIEFKIPKGGNALGFDATLLPKLCEAILTARREGKLDDKQNILATQAEILQGAFATVGIIALVDEATGYQEIRERDELHRILEAYIAKEYLPWTRRFPDEFYRQMFRLRGWTFNEATQKRPMLVGKLTNQLVYEQFPAPALEEIKKAKIDNKKFHQKLTENIGIPHLDKHLTSVITLMKISANWKRFKENFNRAFGGQLSFEDIED